MNLDMAIGVAVSTKPKFGEPCNNCGWCCLTEVCGTGKAFGGGTEAPCKQLESRNGKHYCKLADILGDAVSIGTGCDAKTQTEQIFEMMEKEDE